MYEVKILLFRPYYGISINGDMHGDLGVCEYMAHVYPDLSLIWAATIAQQNKSAELDFIDANTEKLKPSDAEARMGKSYDVIILKAALPTIEYDIEFAKRLKRKYKNAKVVLGGHAAKLLKKWVQNNATEIDEIATVPIEDYVHKLLNPDAEALHLDEFPAPDYNLTRYQNFLDDYGNLRVSLATSRGCSFRCKYCPYASFYGKQIEFRSIDHVMEDIHSILEMGTNRIVFRDQYFTAKRERVQELCERIIEQDLEILWTCETRIESLDEELVDLMVKAGLRGIFFGIESASDEILENMGRKNGAENRTVQLIDYLNEKGVQTGGFYIVGFPEDTWDSIAKTFEHSMKLNTTFAKFSIYDPCMTLKEELSPDMFRKFENTMKIQACKNLTHDQLQYVVNQFTLIQNIKSQGFEHAYYHHYSQKEKYQEIYEHATQEEVFQ
ncbi:Radical SAM superfamily enzyme YgiQ, UPF0313 family [[Clostridium] polysaccharolyticum]|uniref:Radical SAM superfamily enzyme YgiQ, UPF0313 family n=1 Tax=[Clostridium] polysaccharolyticum TaxID=29364 RepID=A0A1I0CQ72_9FIRM|nr:Radical SAM superfamily enzyme YgiQ, UPF0313 family [[Clostridium] polysaccharolyticum]